MSVLPDTTALPDLEASVAAEAPAATEAPAPAEALAPIPAASFADLGVRAEIVEALAEVGITHPFPIQSMTLPVALSRHDIIGQAKTGTGKTLGFAIPILEHVVGPDMPGFDELPAPGKPQALVVVPTRELASQVARDLATAAGNMTTRVVQVYGGRAYEPQVDALARGVEVVVGTPGRMIDLMNKGFLNLSRVSTVVLDEADEMLDLGFLPDVERLLGATQTPRHTMLFSATMPGAVVAMARRYMVQPTHIRAADPDDQGATLKAIKQVVYRAHALDKVEVLARLLQAKGRGLTMIFARTKRTAAKVADELALRGFAAGSIHGDLGQGAREQALRAFRAGKIDVLVATDVAGRGIDVEDVTHVINYQCPEDDKVYLHRTGRTGRAGKTGTAVTFVDWDDMPRWGLINKALDLGFPEPVETYSSSPHLYADLDIPQGVKGTLPKESRIRAGLSAEAVEDLGETGKAHRGGGLDHGHGGGHGSGYGSGHGGGRAGGSRGDAPRQGREHGERHDGEHRRVAGQGHTKPAAADGHAPSSAEPRSGRTAERTSGRTEERSSERTGDGRRRRRTRRRGNGPSAGPSTES